jgi:hypothetical protein
MAYHMVSACPPHLILSSQPTELLNRSVKKRVRFRDDPNVTNLDASNHGCDILPSYEQAVMSDHAFLLPIQEYNQGHDCLKYISPSQTWTADTNCSNNSTIDERHSNGVACEDWAQSGNIKSEEHIGNAVEIGDSDDGHSAMQSPIILEPYDPTETTLIEDVIDSRLALQKARAALTASMRNPRDHMSDEAHFMLATKLKQRNFDVSAAMKALVLYRRRKARSLTNSDVNPVVEGRRARHAVQRAGKKVSDISRNFLHAFIHHSDH